MRLRSTWLLTSGLIILISCKTKKPSRTPPSLKLQWSNISLGLVWWSWKQIRHVYLNNIWAGAHCFLQPLKDFGGPSHEAATGFSPASVGLCHWHVCKKALDSKNSPASRQNTSKPQGLNWPISNWETQKNEWFKGLSIQTLYTPAVVVAKSDLCNSSGWGSLSSTWEAPICPHPMKPPTSVNLRAVPNQGSIFPCWVNTRPERCLAKCG